MRAIDADTASNAVASEIEGRFHRSPLMSDADLVSAARYAAAAKGCRAEDIVVSRDEHGRRSVKMSLFTPDTATHIKCGPIEGVDRPPVEPKSRLSPLEQLNADAKAYWTDTYGDGKRLRVAPMPGPGSCNAYYDAFVRSKVNHATAPIMDELAVFDKEDYKRLLGRDGTALFDKFTNTNCAPAAPPVIPPEPRAAHREHSRVPREVPAAARNHARASPARNGQGPVRADSACLLRREL